MPAPQGLHGVSDKSDILPAHLLRETRPVSARVRAHLGKNGGAWLLAVGVATLVSPWVPLLPALPEFYALGGLLLWWALRGIVEKFPFRVPAYVDQDAKDAGIFWLGTTADDSSACWLSNDDVRTHMLVFGSTGSGKTIFLLGIFYQALLTGSGVLYVDGKADSNLWWMIYALARRLGREDDLLVINYLSRGPDGGPPILHDDERVPSFERLSNTCNPLAEMSAEQARSQIIGLMREADGEGEMWKGRASTMVAALLTYLCALRDQKYLELDIATLREYLTLRKLIQIVRSCDADRPRDAPDLPPKVSDEIVAPLKAYLEDLPGYDAAAEKLVTYNVQTKQWDWPAAGSEVLFPDPESNKQHGFLTMQLTEVLADLSDTYAHIFRTTRGEVDFTDLVFNRRILFVMLPSLQADPDRLAGLGKLVVAGIRAALGPALGADIEGSRQTVIEQKPTNAEVPFVLIMDEYGYYAVPGFAAVAAQARSLGVACVFAGQDYPSFKRGGEEEAVATVANTNVKVAAKIEDSGETFKVIQERAGRANVAKLAGYNPGSGLAQYSERDTAEIDHRDRISQRDLVRQQPGEAHVIWRDEVKRLKLCFVDPERLGKEMSEAAVNRFLQISPPKIAALRAVVSDHSRKRAVEERMVGARDTMIRLLVRRQDAPPQALGPSDHTVIYALGDLRYAREDDLSQESCSRFALGCAVARIKFADDFEADAGADPDEMNFDDGFHGGLDRLAPQDRPLTAPADRTVSGQPSGQPALQGEEVQQIVEHVVARMTREDEELSAAPDGDPHIDALRDQADYRSRIHDLPDEPLARRDPDDIVSTLSRLEGEILQEPP